MKGIQRTAPLSERERELAARLYPLGLSWLRVKQRQYPRLADEIESEYGRRIVCYIAKHSAPDKPWACQMVNDATRFVLKYRKAPDSIPAPDSSHDAADMSARIDAEVMLGSLPARDARVVRLSFAGHTMREIQGITGVDHSDASKAVRRSIKALRLMYA